MNTYDSIIEKVESNLYVYDKLNRIFSFSMDPVDYYKEDFLTALMSAFNAQTKRTIEIGKMCERILKS